MRHTMAMALATLLAQAMVAAPATANPNDSDDALMRHLNDKGVVASSEPAPVGAAEPSRALRLMRTVRDSASELAVQAMGHIGVRYLPGGNSADTGFDCSGFVRHVYNASLGLVLPRRADEQAAAPGFVHVQLADLKPGDLVFFNTLRRTFSHVGIYIGENRFVHSPRSGEEVRTDRLTASYWARRFDGARRHQTAAAASPD